MIAPEWAAAAAVPPGAIDLYSRVHLAGITGLRWRRRLPSAHYHIPLSRHTYCTCSEPDALISHVPLETRLPSGCRSDHSPALPLIVRLRLLTAAPDRLSVPPPGAAVPVGSADSPVCPAPEGRLHAGQPLPRPRRTRRHHVAAQKGEAGAGLRCSTARRSRCNIDVYYSCMPYFSGAQKILSRIILNI